MLRTQLKWLLISFVGSVVGLGATALLSLAQEPPLPYDGIQAGADAYRFAEEQRRARLDDQLYHNDTMRARYGWPPAAGNVIWYGNAGLRYGHPLSIDYAYAYSSERLLRRRGTGLYIERYWSPPLSVFEPWPYVPGDIYGYYFPPQIRQPIGQRQIQIGPNHWESHPVYAEDLEPAPAALPAVEPAPAETPAEKSPAAEEPPVKKLRRRRAF